MTACFVAGRSGGHLIPALTLAREQKQQNKNIKVLFFSANTALDRQLAGGSDVVDFYVPLKLDNVPLRKPWLLPIFGWQFCASFFTARKQLRRHRPPSVLSTGGYISIPVFLAARTLRIPVELFELNVVPGKATNFLARFARTIFICFEQTRKYLPQEKCQFAQYPIRHTQVTNTTEARAAALTKFHFSPDAKTILILGGSQGSVFLNNMIKQWITQYPQDGKALQVIHQTGARDNGPWRDVYRQANITAFVTDFSNDVSDFYAAADLVICRSGAGSLFETLFFKKQCITIPLETTENNHQLDNARAMAESYPDLFTVLRQQEVQENGEILAKVIETKLKQ